MRNKKDLVGEDPLWIALKLLKRGQRFKAHPKFLERLDLRVREEAGMARKILGPNSGDVCLLDVYLKAKDLLNKPM